MARVAVIFFPPARILAERFETYFTTIVPFKMSGLAPI